MVGEPSPVRGRVPGQAPRNPAPYGARLTEPYGLVWGLLHELLDQLPALFLAQPERLVHQRPRLQPRVEHVDRRLRVRVLVEQADWDLLAPLQRLVHRGVEICRVVADV